MWAELTNPGLVDFYLKLQETRDIFKEDWTPMVRAIKYLQSQKYATELFVFTSHANFQITTAADYAAMEGHKCVGLKWSTKNQLFSLSFWEIGKDHGDSQKSLIKCAEEELANALDALILRLIIR